MKLINLKEFVKDFSVIETDVNTEITVTLSTGLSTNVNPMLLTKTFLDQSNLEEVHIDYLREKIFIEDFSEFK